ncbi:MAG: GspE/PulE family protein [Acidobacteriota bacterium]
MGRNNTAQQIRLLLVQRELLTSDSLDAAIESADANDRTLQEELTVTGQVTIDEMLDLLAEVYDVPSTDLEIILRDPTVLTSLPKKIAWELQAAPLFRVRGQLTLAIADPSHLETIDQLQFSAGLDVLPVVVLPQQLRQYLLEIYGPPDEEPEEPSLDALDAFDLAPNEPTEDTEEEEEPEEDSRPVVKLVNLILMRAVQERATDIHIEPTDEKLTVRFRIDGRLAEMNYGVPISLARAVTSRIKVLSKLDIAIQRRPQDGKIRLRHEGRDVDLRVSTYPTIRGEKVVLRVLDKERTNFTLDSIGLSETIQGRWQRLMRSSEGVILVTGPTGSGKSSTLFATLRALHQPEVNIVTLEDPVEYELDGIAQGQVDDKAGFSFASGLRSILRQDPDIILVGEIRDGETAGIAVQAALTGHLVLASLHANDAPSAVARLTDLGVPNYLLSAALLGVMAQRLVRRNCTHCSQDAQLDDNSRWLLGSWTERLEGCARRGAGCEHCTNGYSGRTGVHELLATSPDVATLITAGADRETIARAAHNDGYREMWDDAIGKVDAGVLSAEELLRVLDVPGHPPEEATNEPVDVEARATA